MTSPCKNECIYDNRLGFCKSCGRTMEEISNWSKYSDQYRQIVAEEAYYRLRELRMDIIGQNGNDGAHY